MNTRSFGRHIHVELDGKRITSRTLSRLTAQAKYPQHSTYQERVEAYDKLSRIKLTDMVKQQGSKVYKLFASEWKRMLDVIDSEEI